MSLYTYLLPAYLSSTYLSSQLFTTRKSETGCFEKQIISVCHVLRGYSAFVTGV